MAELKTNVVVVAGPAESGKTTLLTSIFESFRIGPIGGHKFAGSTTLHGFERRCHPSRSASLREVPTTDRTRQVETRFLHLKVRPKDSIGSKHILMTDVSGEAFRLARDYEQECRKLVVLKRADHVAAVIDGAMLLDPRTRAGAVTDVRSLLRRTVELGMIGKETKVQVICSKLDLLTGASESEEALSYLDETQLDFKSTFQHLLGEVTFHRVAARPRKPNLPFAYNIEPLFDLWVCSSSRSAKLPVSLDLPAPTRPFDRFGWSA